jgi:hypothetical protein
MEALFRVRQRRLLMCDERASGRLLYRSEIMTVHKSRPAPATHGHPPAAAADAPDVAAKQEPTYQTSAAQPDSQAERSVLHPEWHDPEWRYYHGAWGG